MIYICCCHLHSLLLDLCTIWTGEKLWGDPVRLPGLYAFNNYFFSSSSPSPFFFFFFFFLKFVLFFHTHRLKQSTPEDGMWLHPSIGGTQKTTTKWHSNIYRKSPMIIIFFFRTTRCVFWYRFLKEQSSLFWIRVFVFCSKKKKKTCSNNKTIVIYIYIFKTNKLARIKHQRIIFNLQTILQETAAMTRHINNFKVTVKVMWK